LSSRDRKNPISSIPYIKEFESSAISLLKDKNGKTDKLEEILEEYASRYAEGSSSRD
jgi:hypothetical protein